MNPRVSICIANYNGIGLIDACIESVRQQYGDAPVEIIVHDDASTDGSAPHIRNAHPGVQLIESTENVGFCVANNRMAAAARGEYLLLLNNDAELMPDALQTLLAASEEIGRPAILTPPQFDHETGELIDRGCLLDPFFNPIPNVDPERHDVAMVMGACLWIPRSLWEELGGFPEWFGSIAEDMYLCCYARLAGYPVKALATSGYRHHVGASFGGGKVRDGGLATTYQRRALSERNKTFVMATVMPGWLLALFLPAHFVLLLMEGIALSLLSKSWTPLSEIYLPIPKWLITKRGDILRTRQHIAHRRSAATRDFLTAFVWKLHKATLLLQHGIPVIR